MATLQQALDNLPAEFVTDTVRSLSALRAKKKPSTDAEVEERIDEYFNYCELSGLRPGVESLSVALHISRKTLFEWKNGTKCSKERQRIVLNAYAFLAAFWEQAVTQGKINPASAIFIAKNWFNYKDTISFEDTTGQPAAGIAQISREEIAQKYANYAEIPEAPNFDD